MRKFDLFDGEWIKVSEEYLEGVSNLENIKDVIEVTNDKIQVNYKNGEIVYYQNVHGSWGFPTKIE